MHHIAFTAQSLGILRVMGPAHCCLLYILGPTTRWWPMSPHFLTRGVSRLLQLALVSWISARIGVHRLFQFAFHISVFFHSLFFICHWISSSFDENNPSLTEMEAGLILGVLATNMIY